MKIADLPSKQVERYIAALQSFEPHRQLLIKVGGGLLEDEVAVLELAEALTELADHNIHTVLVHGGGPQLSKATKKVAINPKFINGKRYTDETTLKLAKNVFAALTDSLLQVFEDTGLQATSLSAAELFSAKRDLNLGLVGTEITAIEAAKIVQATRQSSVLVLAPLAHDETTSETLNVNADTIFQALATTLSPHRMVSLTPTGGVLKPIKNSNTQELISGIDARDVETLINEGIVSGGMALKLRELATILKQLEVGSAISITKPADLLPELLTDQGSGTFVGKGPKIVTTSEVADIYPNLSLLIKEVFGKSLPDGYEKRAIEKIYFTADRLAFGVVIRLPNGTPYLDKLVVSPQLQGRGIGESLWYKIATDFPVIVWRSHATNRYATWYHRHADIMKRQGEWILFGHGIDFPALESMAQELTTIPAMH
jgi:N-acetyl-gamma-glutamyl-phosphate reductase/acetylglutamate kinase